MKNRAIHWLSSKTEKPILRLTEKDYNQNNLSDLLVQKSHYDINLEAFNKLQRTITGWPGGKPNADDTHRPERKNPAKKRVIIFSPHPDDDVVSMGGTFDRLVSQGHDVHIAYQASGNVAVSDHDALKFIDKEQLIVAPDCGLGHLPRDLAKIKLKIMVEASNSF